MYHIFSFSGISELPWESVPVFKTTLYPFTKGSYKPFCMGSLCKTDDGFCVRISSFCFMTDKQEQDSNCVSLCLGKEGKGISISCSQSGHVKVSAFSHDTMLSDFIAPPSVRWLEGSDNIGIYWGCEFSVSKDLLKLCHIDCKSGEEFSFNIVTFNGCDKFFHFGSIFPAPFDTPSVCYLPSESTGIIV